MLGNIDQVSIATPPGRFLAFALGRPGQGIEATKKATTKNTPAVLSGLLEMLESLDGEDAEHIREGLGLFCEKAAEGKNPIMQREILMPFRVALVGSLSGLDISFIVSVIGIEETSKRLSTFLKTL